MKIAFLARGNASRIRPLGGVPFGWISQLRWSPSGDMLAIAGGEGVAVYRGGFGGAADFHLRGHSAPVKDIAFHPGGGLIASCSADTSIKLWKTGMDSFAESAIRAGHSGSVEALAWHPDGSSLASGGADGSIRLWNVASGGLPVLLAAHTDEVTALAFDPSGRWLFSGSRDKSIRRWDLRADYASDIVGAHDDWVREIALSPAGILASASKDMSIRLWDIASSMPTATESEIHRQPKRRWKAHAGGVDALAFSLDDALLISGGRDNCLRIWEAATGRELAALTEHRRPVLTLDLHPAGGLLASGGGDNRVILWGLPSE